MTRANLKGSGGHVVAELDDGQMKKADLGVGELFLAPLGRLDGDRIVRYYCKKCDTEFEGSPEIKFENPNEVVQENMVLKETGIYACGQCKAVIGEYREFSSG